MDTSILKLCFHLACISGNMTQVTEKPSALFERALNHLVSKRQPYSNPYHYFSSTACSSPTGIPALEHVIHWLNYAHLPKPIHRHQNDTALPAQLHHRASPAIWQLRRWMLNTFKFEHLYIISYRLTAFMCNCIVIIGV